jgi:hypothetical protein
MLVERCGGGGLGSSSHSPSSLAQGSVLVIICVSGSGGGSLRSDGGSLVGTPDCDSAVLCSKTAISPAYSGLPVLRWAAIWDGTLL